MQEHIVEFADGEGRKGTRASPEGGSSLYGLLRPSPLGQERGERAGAPEALSGS